MREKAGTQGTQDYEKEDLDRKRGMNGIPIRINHQPTCKSYHIPDRLHGVTRGGKKVTQRTVQNRCYRRRSTSAITCNWRSSTRRFASEVTGVEVIQSAGLSSSNWRHVERGRRLEATHLGFVKHWGSRTAHTYDSVDQEANISSRPTTGSSNVKKI